MQVLVLASGTPDLPAARALGTIEGAWQQWNPADELTLLPVPLPSSPLGETLPAAGFEEVEPGVHERGAEIVVERPPVRSPAAFDSGTTASLAEPLVGALSRSPQRLGLSLCTEYVHDGGRGLLEHIEAEFGTPEATRRAFSGLEFTLIGSEALPLLGLAGAGARLGSVVGQDRAQERERDLADWVAGVEARYAPEDLLRGGRRRLSAAPGAGLGGGAGFAALALGATYVNSGVWAADRLVLEDRLGDLVVLAIPALDAETTGESIVTETGRLALDRAVPVVVLTGANETSRRARASLGLTQAYETGDWTGEVVALEAQRIAQTWSRPVS